MKPSQIYYAKPSITSLEVQYATDAAANGWGKHCYDYIERFEASFASYIGSRHAVATSSGTGALQLGLAALGIGAGDEVILADTNWIASVAPVVHLGATPVFVDILPDSWCLDPQKVEAAITPRTKAIIAVHIYGNLCQMDALAALATKHHLHLIEDAAEAIGSHWAGQFAGTRGIFGIFSFHGTKTITTGEGGMLVSQDTDLIQHVRQLNNHGRAQGDPRQFWASEVGYKFKMSNIQAAIGCAQLERIEALTSRRREIFFTYANLLSGQPLTMNPVPDNGEVYGYWMPTVVFDKATGVTQKNVLQRFNENNIDGRAFFSPLSQQAHFSQVCSNPIASDICTRAINLPSYHEITDEDQDRVAATLLMVLNDA